MWPNPKFPADLVTFTEETLNRKLYFLYSVKENQPVHFQRNTIIQFLYDDRIFSVARLIHHFSSTFHMYTHQKSFPPECVNLSIR